MEIWLSIEVLLNWSSSHQYAQWALMYKAESGSDKELAHSLSENDPAFELNMEVDKLTSRVLEFLTPYYFEVHIAPISIQGFPIESGLMERDAWPAIWYIDNFGYPTRPASGHRSVRALEERNNLSSEGRYKNFKGKWYKRVSSIKVLSSLKSKDFTKTVTP
jgi:hypothetical protein